MIEFTNKHVFKNLHMVSVSFGYQICDFHTFYYRGPQRKPLFKLNERSGNKTSQVHLNSTATTFRDIAVAIYLALCNER